MRGARLKTAGLAEDLLEHFEKGAARFRRGRTTRDLFLLCRRIAKSNGWPITFLMLRRPTGGKAVPAIILENHGSPLTMARTLWPGLKPKLG